MGRMHQQREYGKRVAHRLLGVEVKYTQYSDTKIRRMV